MDWKGLQERLVELLRKKEPRGMDMEAYMQQNRMPTRPYVKGATGMAPKTITDTVAPSAATSEDWERAKRGPYY